VANPPPINLFSASEFVTSSKLNSLWTLAGFATGQGTSKKPIFIGFQTATQTLTSATWTAINLQSESLDTANAHSTVSNTSRFTPGISGTYRFEGVVAFAGSAAGTRHAEIRLNGGTVDGWAPEYIENNFGGGVVTVACRAIFPLNGTTDFAELFGWQDSGAGLATARVSGQWYSLMTAEWISA
jgi:hypothetical protein